MKIAVIGAGNWGRNHARTLHQLGALDGIVEPSQDAQEKLRADLPEVKVYASAEDCEAKAFVIATPAHTHYDIAYDLLRRGADLLVEKPITLSVKEAQELVRLADDRQAVLMAGHLLLYQPAIRFVHDAVHDGMIGQLLSIHQERLNLGKARAFEDVLWSLGVHDVSVALYWTGRSPIQTSANRQCALNKNIADDYYLHLEFEGGIHSHLHVSWLWPELRRRAVLVGTRGMLVYDEIAQTVTLHKKFINEHLANQSEGEEVVFEGAGQPLTLELQHFMSCIETRSKPISDGASAVEVLRVLEAASREEALV